METAKLLQGLKKAKSELASETILCFTSDVDWASEYSIAETLALFEGYRIPLTMFITHPSAVCAKAISEGRIQGGVHPNFSPDSSQGCTIDEVLDYCFSLLPQAECFRAHRYYDVNDVMDQMPGRGILYDSNVCTMLDDVFPFLHRSGIVRVPVFLEDGGYLLSDFAKESLRLAPIKERLFSPGIKVINVHPMHLMLNTPHFSYTRDIKDRLSREEWNSLNADSIGKIAYEGEGIRTFLMEMMEEASRMNNVLMMNLGAVFRYLVN